MLKTTLLAALAAISVCAFAQGQEDHWWTSEKASVDITGKSKFDIKKAVIKQDEYLSGGDAMTFELMLDRMAPNVEDALISGLFCAHRQAYLIRDQIIASQFPGDSDVAATVTGIDQSVLAEETDTTMRPMRMVMTPPKARDIDYNTAFDILTADLNSTQELELATWWENSDERQKDIVVRLLKIDAKKAEEPIYPSLYLHRHYDWLTPAQ